MEKLKPGKRFFFLDFVPSLFSALPKNQSGKKSETSFFAAKNLYRNNLRNFFFYLHTKKKQQPNSTGTAPVRWWWSGGYQYFFLDAHAKKNQHSRKEAEKNVRTKCVVCATTFLPRVVGVRENFSPGHIQSMCTYIST